MADTQVNIQVRTSGQQAVDRLDRSFNKANKSSQLLAGALGKLGAAFAGLTVANRFFKGFAEADKARAAVRSLGVNVTELESQLKRVSVESGNLASTTELLGASYDVASAGFGNAADNAQILEASLKGAVGGMSELGTVSDAVTSVLNAYGMTADQAGKLVDGFIQTQNDGKIVVDQYAQQIGRLAPIAAAAGVSIEEVNAAVSAVTATGVSAESTFAGLRQAIAAILKPTSEASKLADELGINFNAQALEANGLGGVLQDVIDKTGGSQAEMTKLFGSVEALTALLPLTNDNLETYNSNLDNQIDKTGQADKATEDLGGTVTTQIDRILNGIGNVARTLDTVLGPALNRILSKINAIIIAANKALLALTDLDVGAANQALAKGATAISFGATSEGVDQLSASLDNLNPSTARSAESLEKIRGTVFRVQEQLTRIRPEDINASSAVDLQGKAQKIISAVDNRIGELKKLEEKVEEVVKPLPIVDPDPDTTTSSGTGTGSGAASIKRDNSQATNDALKASQDSLAVAAQRLKVSQAESGLLKDEEELSLRILKINQRFDDLAKGALSDQQKQNIELTRGLELRRASLEAQKGMMNSAQSEFNDFFKKQPEAASLLNTELTETEQLVNSLYGSIAGDLTNGIKGLIDGTKDWKDVLGDVLNSISSILLQFGTKMLGASLGIPGFAEGGTIKPNSLAVVGEKGPELVRAGNAPMEVYSNAESRQMVSRGESSLMAMNSYSHAASPSYSPKFETVNFAGENYVTVDQMNQAVTSGMDIAAKQGAKMGEMRTMASLKNNRSARSRIGI
ncbi:phage tail tape measure protein [Synechococcus sp. PROS-U-1]|uniref:phage tail tape measure protein n=1 Tax=Synechococcus sp. PROS-U-1 TaxID=1400866 RepID=UPI001644B3B3|nr:phage tail tape measure protein [Synechococcus sp. PROS-U-1]QNJ03718.1 phage tail tape measure protein/ TP901 family/ core region [Synechococcus sp. PROS-U-1]